MPRRTKEEARATRESILDTAELVFEQQGVSATSLNAIAKAAGLTRGAIYWHFEDKADLFNAMLERVTLPLESADCIGRLNAPDATLDDVCEGLVEVLQHVTRDARAARVFDIAIHKVELVEAMAAVRERRIAMRNGCLADLERAVRRSAGSGRPLPGISARVVALGLFALFDGLLENWMLDRGDFDLPRTARQVFAVYVRSLGAGDPTGPARPITRRRT